MGNKINRDEALTLAQDLGIVHDKRIKTGTLIKKINDLTGKDYEEVEVKKEKTEGTTRCIIHSNDRDNDETEMTVAVLDGSKNERVQIAIGEEVELENKFIPVINDAIIERKVSIFDAEGNPTNKTKTRFEKRYIIEKV